MRELVSYSLAEIEERTGFTRRIIAFYVQQGLLPRVGRRGPRTRYPETFLHRLLLISGIRDLQDQGQLPSATLAEIGQLLDGLTAESLRRLIHEGIPADSIARLLGESTPQSGAGPAAPGPATPPPPAAGTDQERPPAAAGLPAHRASYGLADAGIRQRHPAAPAGTPATGPIPGAAPRSPPASATQPLPSDLAGLGELLRQIELTTTMARQQSAPGAPEQWTQIPVTGRIYLGIRGMAAESAPLAEAAGRLLRRTLRARGPDSSE